MDFGSKPSKPLKTSDLEMPSGVEGELHQKIKVLLELLAKEPVYSADVIVWLQGDRYDRADKVLSLFRAGYAPALFLTGNNKLVGPGPRPGETNISMEEMRAWLIEHDVPESAVIVDRNAFNTPDQARNLIQKAIETGWSSAILVGSSFYQPRVFLTFLKAAKDLQWPGLLINQPVMVEWDQVPGGRQSTARELFLNECEKILNYRNDLAPISQAFEYLQKRKIP